MGMNSEISTYTISVYELQELNFDFGLNDYKIWNEAYRPILNKAILDWYMFREIGYVNPIQWRQRLSSRLDLIMRNKYNALYEAKAIEFNPLYNIEIHETFTHNINNSGNTNNSGEIDYTTNVTNTSNTEQTSNTDSETTSNGLALTSQFPSEEMMEDDLTDNLFVDNANKSNGKETTNDDTTINANSNTTASGVDKTKNISTGTSTATTQETYQKDTVGSSAGLPFSRAMQQLKDYLDDYQLDQQVIEELKDLFIQIW